MNGRSMKEKNHHHITGWTETGVTVWMKLDEKGNPIPGSYWPHDTPPEDIEDYFEVRLT